MTRFPDSLSMVPWRYRVTSVRHLTVDTAFLSLVPVDQAMPRFSAGQFTMVYVFGVGEIPLSISGCPLDDDEILTHTVRSVGAVSDAICRLEPGAVVGIRGPFGTGWDVGDAVGEDLLFVAGGIGLAPLRPALLEALAERSAYGRITVVAGARTPDDHLFEDELDGWRARGVTVLRIVDRVPEDPRAPRRDRWDGSVGLVTDLLEGVVPRPERTVAFICGPEVMMTHTGTALTALGIPAHRVRLSMERNMRCGVGMCGHCQLGTELLCRDGPVTTLDLAAPLFAIAEL